MGKNSFTNLALYFPLVCLFLFIINCAHSLPEKPTSGGRVIIAVIPASSSIINQKIAEMLTTTLKKEDYFIIVERNKIKKVFDEQQFQYSGLSNENTLIALGNLFNAQYVVVGELIDIQKSQTSSSVAIGIYTTKINGKIIDIKGNNIVAVVSESGSSFRGGLGFDVVFQGKEKKDLIGAQRTEDDMLNAAVRSATEKLANSVINAVYNKKLRYIDADTTPNMKIEIWTKAIKENDRSQAMGKLYAAQYDDVWAAIQQYFDKDIMTADKRQGIIITKKFGSSDRRQVFVLIEQDSLNSVRMTVKGFCYSERDKCINPGYKIWQKEWPAWYDSCFNDIWPSPRMCTNVYITKLTGAIKKRIEKKGQ